MRRKEANVHGNSLNHCGDDTRDHCEIEQQMQDHSKRIGCGGDPKRKRSEEKVVRTCELG